MYIYNHNITEASINSKLYNIQTGGVHMYVRTYILCTITIRTYIYMHIRISKYGRQKQII